MKPTLKSILTLFAIGFASCITDGEPYSETDSISDGTALPDFTVTMSDGETFTADDFEGCRGVIVFFNTDCEDCRRELPLMQQVYEQTRHALVWIAIGRSQNRDEAARFWAEHRLTIPYAPEQDRKVYSLFAKQGIPRMYVISNMTVASQAGPDEIQGTESISHLLQDIIR